MPKKTMDVRLDHDKKQTLVVDTPKALNTLLEHVKNAQEIYSNFTQDQVDEIF